jgi:hypothetical protein
MNKHKATTAAAPLAAAAVMEYDPLAPFRLGPVAEVSGVAPKAHGPWTQAHGVCCRHLAALGMLEKSHFDCLGGGLGTLKTSASDG